MSPDYVVEVVGGLSKSLAGQSKIANEALALVEKVREGTSSEVQYHVMRGEVFLVANDKANAKREFIEALRLDRTIETPSLK